MPIYDWRCDKCGFTVRDERTAPFAVCPICGIGEFKKLPAVPSVRFKGQGWQTPSPSGGVKS